MLTAPGVTALITFDRSLQDGELARYELLCGVASVDLDDAADATDRGAFHLRRHGFADLMG